MKKEGTDLSSIVAAVGATASGVGLVVALAATIGFSGTLAASLVAPLAGWALGLGAKYVAERVRKLQTGHRIFISYASQDQELAEKLRDQLGSVGLKAWFAPDQLQLGENIGASIEAAIRDSDVFVALLSDPESKWLREEIRLASSHGVRILPVLSKRDVTVPPELGDIAHIVLEGDSDAAVGQIVRAATG